MATPKNPPSLGERLPVLGKAIQSYQERLTARGRFLLWTLVALSLLGVDTRRTHVFELFAVVGAIIAVAVVFAFLPRPKVAVEWNLPQRLTALTPVRIKTRVQNISRRPLRDLRVSFPPEDKSARAFSFSPEEDFLDLVHEKPAEVAADFRAARRGRFLVKGPTVRSTDPLRLAATREVTLPEQLLLVYPRYYSMEQFIVPVGRRYQPGGIPLSSNTGDSIEFVGTREYREGDPVRNLHWRSWARRGKPVVKEYQEEYFCRLALILDTFLPERPRPEDIEAFEAAISVVASVADFFSRSEYIVDILAAGPDIYEVSAGRSLAYLENILDVLACLEPCFELPFENIGPHLFDKLGQITTVVAVVLDWDGRRENFLRRVKSFGAAVRAVVVHAGGTREPWQSVGEDLGEISLMTPRDVERLLQADYAR